MVGNVHRTATSQKARVSKLEIRSELLNLRLTALSVQPLARPMPRPKPVCRYRRLQLNACADTRWCHIHQGASPVRFALDAGSLGASAADLVAAIVCEDEKGNQLQSLCDLPLQVEGFRFSKQLLRVARLKVFGSSSAPHSERDPFLLSREWLDLCSSCRCFGQQVPNLEDNDPPACRVCPRFPSCCVQRTRHKGASVLMPEGHRKQQVCTISLGGPLVLSCLVCRGCRGGFGRPAP